MNPEPTGRFLPGVVAAAAADPNSQQAASPSSRRSHKQVVYSPAMVAPVEPVWQPDPPLAASSTAAVPAQPNRLASPR